VIAHRPDIGGGGERRPSPPGAGDDSFDFRWIPGDQQAPPGPSASPPAVGASSSAAPGVARREDAENKIVIALTIACTVMALLDLFLLASGL